MDQQFFPIYCRIVFYHMTMTHCVYPLENSYFVAQNKQDTISYSIIEFTAYFLMIESY